MATIKTILQLNKDAADRDQPFIDTITQGIRVAIDTACSLDTNYTVVYDINAQLTTVDGPLQATRIINAIILTLKTQGYMASMGPNNLNVQVLTITWRVAGLPVPVGLLNV
jgi:hypothetical protein